MIWFYYAYSNPQAKFKILPTPFQLESALICLDLPFRRSYSSEPLFLLHRKMLDWSIEWKLFFPQADLALAYRIWAQFSFLNFSLWNYHTIFCIQQNGLSLSLLKDYIATKLFLSLILFGHWVFLKHNTSIGQSYSHT